GIAHPLMAAYNEPQSSVNERGIPIVLPAANKTHRRNPLTPTRPLTPRRTDQHIPTERVDGSPQHRSPSKGKSLADMHDSFSSACFNMHLKALNHVEGASPVKRYPSQFTSPVRKPIVIKELPKMSKHDKSAPLRSPAVHKVAAAMNPGTPSSQQPTALMATEEDIPDYHQQADQESHTTNDTKHRTMDVETPKREKEHLEPEQVYARTVMAQPTDDNKQHAQASVKEDGSQKRKREGPHSKSPEDLLNEEVTEIMDEFTTLGSYYQLVDKIGEGTFSSVYKAVDVRHEYYDNSNWDLSAICNGYERINLDQSSSMSQDEEALDHYHESESQEPQKHYVALKRIYVTSSPERITSEIEILHQLSGSECVVPLITAFRQMDQVMVVLPYLAHDDFRVFYRSMEMDDIRCYFRCLFTALKHVHKNRILHRDIKPGNFLYNYKHRTGMLVDFGLAQVGGCGRVITREDETRPSSPPPTTLSYRQNHNASHSVLKSRQTNVPLSLMNEKENMRSSHFKEPQPAPVGYYKNDSRNPVRANRAGTRGFRAPEVLLRVVHQTVAIDVWAVGVILISILTARFPFFHSEDDADALIEIATIFGLREMKDCASLHNRTFHTNVTTIPKTRLSFMKLCMALNKQKSETWGEQNVRDAVDLLEKCLVLDCSRRISAEEALDHPFFHPSASSPRS
ncbi:hypothetical protein INT44_003402, partial [Umbelopsis vinacea]